MQAAIFSVFSCKNAQCYHIQMRSCFQKDIDNRLSSLKMFTNLLKSVWEQFLINPATSKACHDYCTDVPSTAYKIRWLYQEQFYHIVPSACLWTYYSFIYHTLSPKAFPRTVKPNQQQTMCNHIRTCSYITFTSRTVWDQLPGRLLQQ